VDLSNLTGMFVGLHTMLAMQTNTPELAISEEEGKAFTMAAQNVLRHYSVETTQKTLDTIALVGVTFGIYAPRVVAINVRRRSEDRPARQRQGAGPRVVPFPSEGFAIQPDMHSGAETEA
jgi:hypothetical protein